MLQTESRIAIGIRVLVTGDQRQPASFGMKPFSIELGDCLPLANSGIASDIIRKVIGEHPDRSQRVSAVHFAVVRVAVACSSENFVAQGASVGCNTLSQKRLELQRKLQ